MGSCHSSTTKKDEDDGPPITIPASWHGQQSPVEALVFAVPHRVVPQLLRPLIAERLGASSVLISSIADAASCIVEFKSDVVNGTVRDDDLASLRHLTKLHTVRANFGDSITSVGFAHLHRVQQLRTLETRYNLGVNTAVCAEIGKIKTLTCLNLHYCPQVVSTGVDHLTSLRELTSLTLSHNSVDTAALRYVAQFPKLSSLHLQHCPGVDAAGLALISSILTLTTLNLFECKNAASEGFSTFPNLVHLDTLLLEMCQGVDTIALSHIAHLPQLTTLDLRYCQSVDADSLVHLVEAPRLTSLNLSNCNRIEPRGFEHVGRIPKLRFLDVRGSESFSEEMLPLCRDVATVLWTTPRTRKKVKFARRPDDSLDDHSV